MRSCCDDDTKTSALPTQNAVLTTSVNATLNKNVARVLVTGPDVEITLPFQPPAATRVEVATNTTGTTVVPGSKTNPCDPDDTQSDTFCDDATSVSVTECLAQVFLYFPGDPCADPPTRGAWTLGPEGPRGPQGPTGARGATGPTGPTGPTGGG